MEILASMNIHTFIYILSIAGFFLGVGQYWGLNLGPTLEPLHQPFFVLGFSIFLEHC
jgi:hypothetical protein